MIYTYVLHPKTKQEVSEGFSWYEDKLPGLGYEFLNAVELKPGFCSGNRNERKKGNKDRRLSRFFGRKNSELW